MFNASGCFISPTSSGSSFAAIQPKLEFLGDQGFEDQKFLINDISALLEALIWPRSWTLSWELKLKKIDFEEDQLTTLVLLLVCWLVVIFALLDIEFELLVLVLLWFGDKEIEKKIDLKEIDLKIGWWRRRLTRSLTLPLGVAICW